MPRFNVLFSERAYDAIQWLSETLGGSKAEVVRDAVSLYYWEARELAVGHKLLIQRGNVVTELVIPSLERAQQAAASSKSS